jgi:hypothetical protein
MQKASNVNQQYIVGIIRTNQTKMCQTYMNFAQFGSKPKNETAENAIKRKDET